jgi:thiol-disulfide isomerase/thioredoxin
VRIDPKYFNRFILIAALIGAGLIAFFTLWNKESRERVFRHRLEENTDTLRSIYLQEVMGTDSVRVQQFKQQWVMLDFWASWASPSRQSHQVLSRLKKKYPQKLEIISVASQEPINDVEKYIQKHQYDFLFVKGLDLYKYLNPPGIPTQIIFEPGGRVEDVVIGYHDSTHYDQLRNELKRSN